MSIAVLVCCLHLVTQSLQAQSNCDSTDLTIGDPILKEIYDNTLRIHSDASIHQHNVTFLAEEEIDLQPNFSVDGYIFLADVRPCEEHVVAPALEGFGTQSSFGGGPNMEVCHVTSLQDAGPGTLRDCISNRNGTNINPTPRTVVFDTSGTITLLTDLSIRQPFLTIDGFTAKAPGITIDKVGDGTSGGIAVSTWSAQGACGHDVLIQGIRLQGVWSEQTEAHSQAAGTFGVDGEDLTGCLENIVLNRVTIIKGQDGAGDIWGSARNITYQYSAFLRNLHPATISHAPGGEAAQARKNISIHHNLFAYSHERTPQIRGCNSGLNLEQNIMHQWDAYGFGGGYGTRIRCRNGGCPDKINLIGNHYTTASVSPSQAVILGETSGADPDQIMIAPQVFMSGNFLPPKNVDFGTALTEFPRDIQGVVTLIPKTDWLENLLPKIGAPFRTQDENQIFTEVEQRLAQDAPEIP